VICFARLVSFVTVVEIGLSLPLLLLLLENYDVLAILASYEMLAMALYTQVIKRFCFRTRPFAVGRAQGIVVGEGPDTSSFPCRSVVGATVYSCLLTMVHQNGLHLDSIPWGPMGFAAWFWILLFVMCTSWGRIFLGCHYPSCCLSGFAVGLAAHFTGVAVARTHLAVCDCSRGDAGCSEAAATLVIMVGVPLATLVMVTLTIEPFAFWKKSTHAFGLLVPPLIFILAFLCPSLTGIDEKISTPGSPSAATTITAFGITGVLTAAALATQKQHPLTSSDPVNTFVFLFLIVVALLALLATRAVKVAHSPSAAARGPHVHWDH